LDVEIRQHSIDRHTVVKGVLMLNDVDSWIGPVFRPIYRPQKRSGGDGAFPREKATGDAANGGLKDGRRAGRFRARRRPQGRDRLRGQDGFGCDRRRWRRERLTGRDDGDVIDGERGGRVIVSALQRVALHCEQLDGGVSTLIKDHRSAVHLSVRVIRDQEARRSSMAFADGHVEEAGVIEEQGRVCFDGKDCARRLLGRSDTDTCGDAGSLGIDAGAIIERLASACLPIRSRPRRGPLGQSDEASRHDAGYLSPR
jgi:prepilin-type processing-associated H-X9-DG protein